MIFMKFGMNVMPSENTPTTQFLISYSQ